MNRFVNINGYRAYVDAVYRVHICISYWTMKLKHLWCVCMSSVAVNWDYSVAIGQRFSQSAFDSFRWNAFIFVVYAKVQSRLPSSQTFHQNDDMKKSDYG